MNKKCYSSNYFICDIDLHEFRETCARVSDSGPTRGDAGRLAASR